VLVRTIAPAGYRGERKIRSCAVTAALPIPNSKQELDDVEDTLRASLLLALAGDNEAYAAFLTRSSARVRAYFRRRLVAFPDEVEDLVQETLLALHNQRHTYRPSQPVTPWLHAIARYKLVDLLRAQSPRRAVEVSFDDDDAKLDLADDAAGDAEAHRDLLKLLASLPDRYRVPIVLVKLEGRSVAEASAATGMSASAIKVGIHRGLKKLAAEVARRR
jgi:RNA polymerase sigma-70 factor (ECF subfamily)